MLQVLCEIQTDEQEKKSERKREINKLDFAFFLSVSQKRNSELHYN